MVNRFFVFLISLFVRFYQSAISPYMGTNCRYSPSCSQYMLEAVKIHGSAKGFWLGLVRISKCHPFGGSGNDPVPQKK